MRVAQVVDVDVNPWKLASCTVLAHTDDDWHNIAPHAAILSYFFPTLDANHHRFSKSIC